MEKNLPAVGNLINWKFHNQPVFAHKKLEKIFNEKWVPLMEEYSVKIVEN